MHDVEQVPIPIERHGHGGMAQLLLDLLNTRASEDGQSRCRVPKVMHCWVWREPGSFSGRAEHAIAEVRVLNRPASLRGEHQGDRIARL